jgi:hypothetical protein
MFLTQKKNAILTHTQAIQRTGKGKGIFHPRIGRESPEGDYVYSSALLFVFQLTTHNIYVFFLF